MRSIILASLTALAAFSASPVLENGSTVMVQALSGMFAAVMSGPLNSIIADNKTADATLTALQQYDAVVGRSDNCLYDSNGGMSCSYQGNFVGYLSAADIAAANRELIASRAK
jgi:hypothetical protein